MIVLKDVEKFEQLAKEYKVKYLKSPESRGGYIEPRKDSGASSINMDLVAECLYANIPAYMRIKK